MVFLPFHLILLNLINCDNDIEICCIVCDTSADTLVPSRIILISKTKLFGSDFTCGSFIIKIIVCFEELLANNLSGFN